jgi:hypothetical protein
MSISSAQFVRLEYKNNPLNYPYNARIDSSQMNNALSQFKNYYLSNGFLGFSYDSILFQDSTYKINNFLGERYRIKSIAYNLSNQKKIYPIKTTYFDTLQLKSHIDYILSQLENSGYPFSKVKVKIDQLDSNDLNYHLEINKGPLFIYDTLHIEGERLLKSNFLEAYLGIKNKSPFNETLFKKVNGKINQLPFVSSERTPLVAFIEGGLAKPYIYLKKKKADQINGIIGLAPGNNSTQAFVFTGEFLLKLNNLFKSAKSIHLNWRSFNARSQELKAQANLPYLFAKPIGLDYSLDFLKFDTLYTSVQNQIGFKYYTSGLNGIKAFYQTSITNLNSVDTFAIRVNKKLPSIHSISNNRYGLEGYYNHLDYIFNPQRGWIIDGQLLVGSRTLLRDNIISQVKFENQKTLYDSMQLKTTQLFYKIKYDQFFKLGNSSTFKLGIYMTQIVSDNLYFNELLREGGINSLKGFNEQSIFASNFNMLDIEYRYLISKDSYFKVFWNGAYYENKQVELGNNTISDFPWGFGVGGQIETGAGILSIIYALGKEKNNPFDLRTGKIHFGISNFF